MKASEVISYTDQLQAMDIREVRKKPQEVVIVDFKNE